MTPVTDVTGYCKINYTINSFIIVLVYFMYTTRAGRLTTSTAISLSGALSLLTIISGRISR